MERIMKRKHSIFQAVVLELCHRHFYEKRAAKILSKHFGGDWAVQVSNNKIEAWRTLFDERIGTTWHELWEGFELSRNNQLKRSFGRTAVIADYPHVFCRITEDVERPFLASPDSRVPALKKVLRRMYSRAPGGLW
jgi:hypothetical protein